jgi:hypothetical protein
MRKTAIFSVIILLSFLLLYILLPTCELKRKTENLDNSIVNSRYAGWQDVSLDEKLRIKLPPGWSICMRDHPINLDGNGVLIGEGVKAPPYSGDTVQDLLSNHHGKSLVSFSVHDKMREKPRIFWNLSYCIFRTNVYDDGSESKEIIFTLNYSNDYEYGFCLYYTDEQEKEMYDIAEAIAWSVTSEDSRMIWIAKKALNLI